MYTIALIVLPLICSLFVLLFEKRWAGIIASIGAVAELLLTLLVFTQFEGIADPQFVFNTLWIETIGVSFHVGIDGISLILLLLTNILIPFIVLSALRSVPDKSAGFFGLILLMQSALVGVFTAYDGLLFYLFWEVALIPIYFICLLWGSEDRSRITFKFFVYTLAGSLVMLAALIYLYLQTPGTHSFELNDLYAAGRALPVLEQSWLFWTLFIAFAIKMPIFPFHTWQPDTYTVAPVQGTMLLSGIMLKMGIYGAIRWLIPVVPLGVAEWGLTASVLSVTGIVYASCIAIVQKDYKRLIAYSSIAHVGLIAAGIFTLNSTGVQGAMIQMVSHGIIAFGLFYCIDIIDSRTKTRVLDELGGIRNVAPVFTTVFIIIMLGSVSLPLTSNFVGEFLLLNALFNYKWWLGALGGLTIILGAVYMLKSFQKSMSGEVAQRAEQFQDLTLHEKVIIYPIVVLIILIGIYPSPLLELSQASVDHLLSVFGSSGVAIK